MSVIDRNAADTNPYKKTGIDSKPKPGMQYKNEER